jgi:hypothetical protein
MDKSATGGKTGGWPRRVDGTYLPQWRLEIKMVVLTDMGAVKFRWNVDY